MTKSEKFVADLCDLSFLPFWSFPSPLGKKGNELCDLLVVCNNTIIIISVKDISPTNHEDDFISFKRWVKKAIEDSVSQINGAESFLEKIDSVLLKNSSQPISLPPKDKRQVFRIAIAFGKKEHYPFPIAHNKKSFVHVFDETATTSLLKELDTITDFSAYLFAKEQILSAFPAFFTSELDFLAHYQNSQLPFRTGKQVIIKDDCKNAWEVLKNSSEYKEWKHDIEASYMWDILIHSCYLDYTKGKIPSEKRNEIESALRLITLENRINRIDLAHALEETNKTNLKARIFVPAYTDKYSYVFLHLDQNNYERREQELSLRCYIARAEIKDRTIVIGVSAGRTSGNDFVFDVHYLNLPEITDEFIRNTERIKNELGYFKNITKFQK